MSFGLGYAHMRVALFACCFLVACAGPRDAPTANAETAPSNAATPSKPQRTPPSGTKAPATAPVAANDDLSSTPAPSAGPETRPSDTLTFTAPPKPGAAQDGTQPASPVVLAARSQIGVTRIYDPAYVGLKYPNGDVPPERGVCTDVVIRALRTAHEFDLQKQVHEDMKRAFSKYPTIWRARRPDRNIDHRRVPNLRRFFERRGWSLPVTQRKSHFQPGDIVTCTVGGGRPHIMVVSDRKTADGVPLVIHNIGVGTQEEDMLFAFPLTGHYRPKLTPEQE